MVVVLGLAWRFATTSPALAVTTVEVRNDPEGLVSSQIKAAILGQNILTLGESSINNLSRGPVEKIFLSKVFPNKVIATVEFRTPLYSWQTSQGRYLVDSSGLAYGNAASEQLIEVTDLTSSTGLGEKVEAAKLGLLTLLTSAAAGQFSVLTASFTGSDLTATLTSGTVVYLSGGADPGQIHQALQLILSKAKIDGRLPRTIDLRYPKPVVTY